MLLVFLLICFVAAGPGKKKKGEEIVAKMFKEAKKHGAVTVEESHSSNAKHGKIFQYKLSSIWKSYLSLQIHIAVISKVEGRFNRK